ncbi:signal peptide peptidase SppA [Algibacillus agarilyticus]|uniref:signal peptide peptidase SppA n=1 Tax=Algibacillus agarilyticus TaxID=2234133 RepID=UPI000DCFA5DD|nr:signal peptide peptidase SppA [Algibacillus agarilyticus]
MTQQKSTIGRIFSALWGMINTTRKLIINLIFFSILFVILAAIMAEDEQVNIPQDSALVLDLSGDIVEQLRPIDPVEEFMAEASNSNNRPQEILLSDIIFTLENAAGDPRIKAVVLRLQDLKSASINKLQLIGNALDKVKTAEKTVYAIGDVYTQNQYFLASYADKIMLDPMGAVMIDGFGAYPTYYKSALEKLKVSTHIFRVGTYKSAVEPMIRDNMSEAAKKANQAWVDALWSIYKQEVSERRNMATTNFDENLSTFTEKFLAADSDFAKYALDNKWVDELADRQTYRSIIAENVGWNKKKTSFKQISFKKYLNVIKPVLAMPKHNDNQIAVIYAKGTILNGHQKAGDIGGDSTAQLLQKARLNDKVKAVVLRIDSPGGSAFASEIIRKEIDLIKAAGKPIVASMSSVAASGGYWIATSADQIWASPSTITGSIGVFGMFMTFENTLDYLGVHTDGVGSTEWSGLGVTQPLNSKIAHVIQMSVEKSYKQFISLVAETRDMTVEQVDKIAQGRVWTGLQAKELGLVDELGNFDSAIAAAAKLAELENYDTITIEQELSAQEQFIKELLGNISSLDTQSQQSENITNNSKLATLLNTIMTQYNDIAKLNDPRGLYVHCLACPTE